MTKGDALIRLWFCVMGLSWTTGFAGLTLGAILRPDGDPTGSWEGALMMVGLGSTVAVMAGGVVAATLSQLPRIMRTLARTPDEHGG